MPEPTAAELAKEAEQEAAVFSQAVNVEKLLNMLRALDPAKDNLADNEEIQVRILAIVFIISVWPLITALIGIVSIKYGFASKDRQTYRQVQPEARYGCLFLRSPSHPFLPSIADLVSMNETFVRARTIFDRMMEESLARHSGGAFSPLVFLGSFLPSLLDVHSLRTTTNLPTLPICPSASRLPRRRPSSGIWTWSWSNSTALRMGATERAASRLWRIPASAAQQRLWRSHSRTARTGGPQPIWEP